MKFGKQCWSWFLVCLLVLMVVGCTTDDHSHASPQVQEVQGNPTKNGPGESQQKVNSNGTTSQQGEKQNAIPVDNDPLQVVGLQLEAEFKSYLSKIATGENNKINYIMSADRLQGIQALNPKGDNLSGLITANRDKVNQQLQNSLVYSGYTTTGLHFLAVVQPNRKSDVVYRNAVGIVRGDQNEYQFLNDILQTGYRSMDGGYNAVDLYAEDLQGKLSEIPVEDVTISNEKGMSIDDKTGRVKGYHPVDPKDPKLTQVLSQYKRTLGDIHAIANKSWNLFVFSNQAIISPDYALVVEIGGKHVVLYNMWL